MLRPTSVVTVLRSSSTVAAVRRSAVAAVLRHSPVVAVPERTRDLFARYPGAPFVLNPGSDYGKDYTPGEVARLLDLPEGTVKSRLFLARQRLKELLQ